MLHSELSRASASIKKSEKENIEVVWPQDCAFVGHLKSCVTYEQLTQSQFVLGFLRSVQDGPNPFMRSNNIGNFKRQKKPSTMQGVPGREM